MSPPRPRRWLRVLLMVVVFLSGCVVGGVGGAVVIRNRIVTMLKHPEQVPDRVVVLLRRKFSLTPEQTEQVEQIVRARHAAIESIRAENQPRIAAELQQLQDEVAAVLTPLQQEKWQAWCDYLRAEVLPAPPSPPMPADSPAKDSKAAE